jgi:hypothetical protein
MTPTRGQCFRQQRGWLVVVVHRSWPYMAFQALAFNEIFTNDIDATRRTHFAHLGMTAGDDGG